MPRRRRTRALIILGALVVGLWGGLSACSSTSKDQSGDHLAAAAFQAEVAKAGTVVVDVRTPPEYAGGHLSGAVNIDAEASDFGEKIAALDKAASYAVYCQSGRRSGIALEKMADAGFTHVVDLTGGVAAWAAQGGELVTE